MKKLYPLYLLVGCLLLMATTGHTQCPGGYPSGGVAYDTTVFISQGMSSKQIKLPKLDPQSAMLSCVRLIVTMVGVVNNVGLQNMSSGNNTASFNYDRTDNVTGPGLTPALNNSYSYTYGPYVLAPFDGVTGSGPDYHAIVNDTAMKATMVRTLTDSTTISQFYGTDSLVYNYSSMLMAYATFSGDNSSSISTSSLVRFRLEYCTCPLFTLPVGLKNFTVLKRGNQQAELRWEAEAGNDSYFYEIEVSTNGRDFTTVGRRNKQGNSGAAYQFTHLLKANEQGRRWFRVKQRWLDGYHRYTDIIAVDFTPTLFANISLYPNPASGQVGLKFVAAPPGLYRVEIANAGGQVVVRKQLSVLATDYRPIANLAKGTYYVKIIEPSTQASTVQQLVVQ